MTEAGTELSEGLRRGAARMRKTGLFREECLEIEQAADLIDDLVGALGEARRLLERYRHDTPLGHQPHMIAHVADTAIAKIDAALAKAKP